MKRNFKILLFLFVFVSTIFAKTTSSTIANSLIETQENNETYPFKPTDGLLIDAFPDTNSFLNKVFPIDDRGYTEFPIVGKVQVSKMTKSQLENFIKETYKNYLRYPNIYVKPVVRISLLGGFIRPGLYYVDVNNSLWDAVYEAGGTVLEDGIYEMHWERDNETRSDNIAPLFEKGISLNAMGFKSGDQIWTPSPDARTIWDTVSDIMPILTFATTVMVVYNTYQRDSILLSR
jgi:polysaccharide export outer membrane protein